MRGGRGVASRCPSGCGATRLDGSSALLIDNLLLEFTACFSIFAMALVSAMYMSAFVSFAVNVLAPVNDYFSNLAILLDVDNYMSASALSRH